MRLEVSIPGREVVRVDIGSRPLVVGRDPAADIVIPSPSASRRHCRIIRSADGVTVEDLGSANGTKVGGQPISAPFVLGPGSEFVVGNATIRVAEGGTPSGRRPAVAAAPAARGLSEGGAAALALAVLLVAAGLGRLVAGRVLGAPVGAAARPAPTDLTGWALTSYGCAFQARRSPPGTANQREGSFALAPAALSLPGDRAELLRSSTVLAAPGSTWTITGQIHPDPGAGPGALGLRFLDAHGREVGRTLSDPVWTSDLWAGAEHTGRAPEGTVRAGPFLAAFAGDRGACCRFTIPRMEAGGDPPPGWAAEGGGLQVAADARGIFSVAAEGLPLVARALLVTDDVHPFSPRHSQALAFPTAQKTSDGGSTYSVRLEYGRGDPVAARDPVVEIDLRLDPGGVLAAEARAGGGDSRGWVWVLILEGEDLKVESPVGSDEGIDLLLRRGGSRYELQAGADQVRVDPGAQGTTRVSFQFAPQGQTRPPARLTLRALP